LDECTPLKDIEGKKDLVSGNEKSDESKEEMKLSKLALSKQKTAPLRKTKPGVECEE